MVQVGDADTYPAVHCPRDRLADQDLLDELPGRRQDLQDTDCACTGASDALEACDEDGDFGIAEIREVVSTLHPDRIGHGILAAQDEKLMTQICEAKIVLEICPTSNLLTKALPDEDAVRDTFRVFVEHKVPFTIATDGPEMMRTHLRDEFELLLRIGALDEAQVSEAIRRGHEASFID